MRIRRRSIVLLVVSLIAGLARCQVGNAQGDLKASLMPSAMTLAQDKNQECKDASATGRSPVTSLRRNDVNTGLRSSLIGEAYPRPRHINYRFILRNTGNQVIEDAELWFYLPAPIGATQYCEAVEVSQPYEVLDDKLGNRIARVSLQEIPPFGTILLRIRADLRLASTPVAQEVSEHERAVWLQPEPYCEVDDPAIRRLAERLRGDDDVRTARTIFRWVADHLRDSGYLKHERGAKYALTHKQGDCTEYMYLFVALCRAAGIPARGLGGYVVTRNTVLDPATYHNWAECYLNGAWQLADPQRRVFMQDQADYLVMRIVGPAESNVMGRYQRFRYRGEGLAVFMDK